MDSYHHHQQQQQHHWDYLTALTSPSAAPLHGLHPPSFPAEHPPSPDTRPLVSASLSRKRSASAVVSLGNADPSGYDDPSSVDLSEDHEMRSPIDGSSSNSGAEDSATYTASATPATPSAISSGIAMFGKPVATSNFVTKLYQMINDPKSTHFIAWTDLGTSFVVSNVGEFSRSILGSHFKHNNFSSFVRQLNMYGFHKINRTPRAQRTSTDAQTWEFSHHKFLRGRPDLLDEIKRKALEPDPTIKHRVELPGEVAAQLATMRDENQRLWEHFNFERKKSERLFCIVNKLWDAMRKTFPGSISPFPNDVFDSNLTTNDNPNIYVTSPTSAKYLPSLSINFNSPLHSVPSPSSSPTSTDFPHSHSHHPIHSSLSRQQSFQHVAYAPSGQAGTSVSHPTDATDTTSPSPSSMEGVYDDEHSTGCANSVNANAPGTGPRGAVAGIKRQRLSVGEQPAMSTLHGLGMNVNMNGYNHHLQPHSHPNQYASAAHSHHAHHLTGDGSTVSSPGTTTAPSSLLGHLPGIAVISGAPAGLGSGVANSISGVKRSSRARSDSAPLGPYTCTSDAASIAGGNKPPPGGSAFNVGPGWLAGRPRSGSGLVTLNRSGPGIGVMGGHGRNMGNMTGLANLNTSSVNAPGTVSGAASQPLLSHSGDAIQATNPS